MVRAIAIGAVLAGVIVACGFRGQAVTGDGGGGTDAHVPDSSGPPGDGSIVDARADARPDAVVPDARPDAFMQTCNSGICGNAGGNCSGTVCVFNPSGSGALVCPPGEACVFNCNSGQSCDNIDCRQAHSCTINCEQGQTCQGPIMCGNADCTINCNSGQTCNGQLSATGSCTRTCCSGPTCGGTNTGCTTIDTGNAC